MTKIGRGADMFLLTVSPSRATTSTGCSRNLWTLTQVPTNNVSKTRVEVVKEVRAISTITSAACPAPLAALAGRRLSLHHEGETTTNLPLVQLCNSSHVMAQPFKRVAEVFKLFLPTNSVWCHIKHIVLRICNHFPALMCDQCCPFVNSDQQT